jgi:hypothetical protein
LQIAAVDGEEISLFLSDICASKSHALSVYRRAVANLTIQNGDGAIRGRRMSLDPASWRRLFSHAFAPPPSSRGEPDAGASVQDRLAPAAGSWPQLLEPYRSRIAIGCHERRLKTHSCALVRVPSADGGHAGVIPQLRSDQSSSNPLCGTKWFDSHFCKRHCWKRSR